MQNMQMYRKQCQYRFIYLSYFMQNYFMIVRLIAKCYLTLYLLLFVECNAQICMCIKQKLY